MEIFNMGDNKININWLTNDKTQFIRFRDRFEYRENNKLSRTDGPAIEYFSVEKDNLYYINGKKLTIDEFKLINKNEKIKQL